MWSGGRALAVQVVINENRVSEDIGIMCAIALVFKLFFTIIVWRKCNPHTQIKAPAPLAKPLEAIRQSLSAVSHVVSSKIGTASTKSGAERGFEPAPLDCPQALTARSLTSLPLLCLPGWPPTLRSYDRTVLPQLRCRSSVTTALTPSTTPSDE